MLAELPTQRRKDIVPTLHRHAERGVGKDFIHDAFKLDGVLL